ncbi:DUF3857 domain-containing protein [Carboxylicivirga mesophila]|uniref:DUF3857 domain-containing protein n=1 Tax=Carboxylicivirga mesophila TaxID=1166478 RepID=A0ABS5KE03_9BACT|nr:DUF3857 domain-containing protein [Carboxylicivirga mesophila]MBS2212723.1 DUF3857 domain-containing protein [Carboxylicivirga mesophila]
MKTLLFTILLFTSWMFNKGMAQEIEFGSLRPCDAEIQACAYEKDAPAVVLFDKGDSWFVQDDGGFVLRFDRHVRIKIFNEAAFNKGEFEIPLYKGGERNEEVKEIEGITFNIEGGRMVKVELDKKNVYREDINEYWYMKKFAMPQVKEGSIIDVKYTVYSHYFEHFRDWEFQMDIPVLYSEYKVNMIPFFSYRYRLQGATTFDHYKKYDKKGLERTYAGIPFKDVVYEFGFENVPSFKDESFISSRNDYIKKIDFQLSEINSTSGYSRKYMNTWPSMAKELLDHPDFGKYIKKAEKWGSKTFTHLSNMPEEEQLDKILTYMKQHFTWNHYTGKRAQYSFKEFNEKLSGNIGNINLSAIGVMRALGLQASPVIISTRDNGKVTDSFPYSNLFNYVLILVEVDKTMRLVDATQDMCPNHLIPSRCINGKGFIVEEDSEKWVTISNAATSLEELNMAISVNVEEGALEGLCLAKCTGYSAVSERKAYYNSREKFEKKISSKGLKVENMEAVNLSDSSQPFKYSFKFSQAIDRIDNQLILSPFANLVEKENPFKQEDRSLPVDLVYLRGNRFITTIQIPEGYKVEALPSPQKINSENVSFSFIAQTNAKQVQMIASYNFKKQTYPADTYKELKRFMNAVTSAINSKIILTKVDNNLADL